MLSIVVHPGERNLVILGQRALREVLSTDEIADLRSTVMALSGDRTRSGLERESSDVQVGAISAGVGTVSMETKNPRSSLREVLDTRQAMKLTLAAYGLSRENVPALKEKEGDGSLTTNPE